MADGPADRLHEPAREGRVLLLLGPSTGGIRRHVEVLQKGLVDRGWEVEVAGPAGVLAALGAPEDGEDATHAVAVPAGLDPVGLARAARQLHRLRAAGAGWDIVHAHGLKAGWSAVAARAHPLVLTVHNTVLPGQGGAAEPVLRWLAARVAGRAEAVIATSAALAGELAPVTGAGQVSVIRPVGPVPSPRRSVAEVRAELAVGAAPLVVGVGRLHPQKGWDVLVAAVSLVRAHVPSVRAVIAGDGPLAGALAAQARALDLDPVLTLVGEDLDAVALLAAADVVVVSSVWESGPLVLAEAMWLGRPVVSTRVGFAPELLAGGEAGRLVPVGDPAVLAGAIEAVLGDPAGARAMGEAGRRRVGTMLDPDRLVDEVAGVYRRVRRARCA